MNLLVATENPGKLKEITALLADTPFQVKSVASQHPDFIPPPEDGQTFEENALIKITSIPHHPNTYYLSDDSGIQVTALNNRPGVHSARYGGPGLTDQQRTQKLLEELKNTQDRRAQFTSVIALITPSGTTHQFEGVVKGTLTDSPRGSQGFGYDPIFVPDGHDLTFAEGGPELKKLCSHRAIALGKAIAFILA